VGTISSADGPRLLLRAKGGVSAEALIAPVADELGASETRSRALSLHPGNAELCASVTAADGQLIANDTG
jgi:hypothetical protein